MVSDSATEWTLPNTCGAQLALAAPLVASIAASEKWELPATVVNTPPAKIVVAFAASARTTPSGSGFHGVAVPVPLVLTVARLFRSAPPIEMKLPPTTSVKPRRTSALTGPSGSGPHDATVLLARMCARFCFGTPPIAVNSPPTYQPPEPSGIATFTMLPDGSTGNVISGSAEVRSTSAQGPVG